MLIFSLRLKIGLKFRVLICINVFDWVEKIGLGDIGVIIEGEFMGR